MQRRPDGIPSSVLLNRTLAPRHSDGSISAETPRWPDARAARDTGANHAITQYFANIYSRRPFSATGGGQRQSAWRRTLPPWAPALNRRRHRGEARCGSGGVARARRQSLSGCRRRARHRRPGRSLRSQPRRAWIHGNAHLRRSGQSCRWRRSCLPTASRRWSISTCLVPLTPQGPPLSTRRQRRGSSTSPPGMAYTPMVPGACRRSRRRNYMMMKNLVLEWGRFGIRINSIDPAHRRHRRIEALVQRRGKANAHHSCHAPWVRSTISARPPPFLPRRWPPISPAASLLWMADAVRGGLTRVPRSTRPGDARGWVADRL